MGVWGEWSKFGAKHETRKLDSNFRALRGHGGWNRARRDGTTKGNYCKLYGKGQYIKCDSDASGMQFNVMYRFKKVLEPRFYKMQALKSQKGEKVGHWSWGNYCYRTN